MLWQSPNGEWMRGVAVAGRDVVRAAGTTLDDVRRQNLTQVLRLVHREGPVSRAELTRATGLNRSTIGGLVAELQGRGLVDETEPERTRKVGRPSPVVAVSERVVALAVNPEIDAVEVAVVSLGGRVLRRMRLENEGIPSPEAFVDVVSAAIERAQDELDASYSVLGIGLAVPGLVHAGDGRVQIAPHLEWRDAPLSAMLAERSGLRVVAGNDANCGVVAESIFGAARGIDSVIYLNGGASGIGSGVALGGELLTGASGYAGEFGHTLVESHGTVCHCGAVGCLETEVRRERLLAAVGLDNANVAALPAALERAWADATSPGATEVRRQVDYLGVALRNIVNALNPRRIVLGGFLATLLGVVGETQMRAFLRTALPGARDDVSITAATLGDTLLLVGAAELAFAAVLDDPALMPLAPLSLAHA